MPVQSRDDRTVTFVNAWYAHDLDRAMLVR
jgi:hypothetical protein